jgi:hypothetical protein
MTITIDVTNDDIHGSSTNPVSTADCMVAHALKRYVEPRYIPSVGIESMGFLGMPDFSRELPRKAATAIQRWISWRTRTGARPRPFSFQLDLPAHVLRMTVPALRDEELVPA